MVTFSVFIAKGYTSSGQIKDAAEHPIMQRTAPNKGLSTFNANSVKAGNRKEGRGTERMCNFQATGYWELVELPF